MNVEEKRANLTKALRSFSYFVFGILTLAIVGLSYLILNLINTYLMDISVLTILGYISILTVGLGALVIEYYLFALQHMNENVVNKIYERSTPLLKQAK